MKLNITCAPEYIEYFANLDDGLDSFVFINAKGSICSGFRDLDSGNMIEVRQNFPSVEAATKHAKSLVGA